MNIEEMIEELREKNLNDKEIYSELENMFAEALNQAKQILNNEKPEKEQAQELFGEEF